MGAFDNAWTLLKNRGFEMDPRYEDERERNIQLVDDLEELEMMEALSTPSQYREMVDSRNRQLSQLGPMYQHQQDQEAERIEAEGIDLPDVPSSAPPADIGRAGSLTPEPFIPDLEQMKQRMSPLGQALAQARSQPPQPLQFEKAWATLKADPNMLDTQGRSIPPALTNPQNFDTTGDAERGFQSIRDAVLAAGMPYYGNLRQRLLDRIHRTPRPSAYHFLQDADEEEEQTMRQNERRFGPLGSILAQDTDKGREFYQYRGPDVSNMYAPVPQPE